MAVSTLPSPQRPARLVPRPLLAALLPPALAAIVFRPILRNFFFQDDFIHLYHVVNDRLLDYLLLPWGGHMLLVRNALFVLFYEAFGTRASLYLKVVLLTHLLNVGLLFRVTRLFTGSALLACFGATLWGISPLHEGTLGWYSAYGHAVCGTTLLLALAAVGSPLAAGRPVSTRTSLLVAVLLLLGSTCFGVGIAVAACFPLVLVLLAPRPARSRWSLPLLLAVGPIMLVLYTWTFSRSLSARSVPLPILIEMWTAWRPVGTMLLHLLGYGVTALALGFFAWPATYPDRRATLVLVLAGASLAFALVRSSPGERRRLLAFALLAVASYASIAVGRGALYDAFHGSLATAAISARYHYVALVPVTLVVCLTIQRIGGAGPLRRLPGSLVLAAWLAVAATGYWRCPLPVRTNDEASEATWIALGAMHARIAASPVGEPVVIQNQPFRPAIVLRARFPGLAGLFLVYHRSNLVDDRRVYFAMPEPERSEWLRDGGPLASLLVPATPPTPGPPAEPHP